MSTESVDRSRRRFLTGLTTGVGLVGTGFAVAPFVLSMTPSAKALAAGAPVEVDISKLEPGQLLTVEWRGKPVWLLNRTPEMMKSIKDDEGMLTDPMSKEPQQPAYVDGETRSIKKGNVLIVVGICTHLGCSPVKKLTAGTESGLGENWPGGFFCPCHGSKFDLSGRVFKNVPAPRNLVVPPHSYKSAHVVEIGVDTKAGVA